MSTETETPSLPERVLRTVTPGTRGHPDSGMDAFGWGILLGLLVLLVPLLPFVAIVWLFSRLAERLDPRTE